MLRKCNIIIAIVFVLSILVVSLPALAEATITGECSNCHTMHNSQNGSAVSASGPNELLLKADCLGCHAMGTANRIETLGTSSVPQVLHTDPAGDLAGGNFAYITGTGGYSADDTHGHNVIDFGVAYKEDVNYNPPGAYHAGQPTADELTCAGKNGCHGIREVSSSGVTGILALKGAHHGNVNGQLSVADTVANSYRFLWGVKGYEAGNWQNIDSNNHNEYFGASSPLDYNTTGCGSCHDSSVTYVKPNNQTISGFCGGCHGNFHLLDGIGGDTTAPFTRHPTDIIIPSGGEFDAYTTYNIDAPVARTTVPSAPSSTVSSGTDVVMCLSCHKAHATAYPDMLRWDYTTIVTGGSGGCLICHTGK